jgi:hypothetical protein
MGNACSGAVVVPPRIVMKVYSLWDVNRVYDTEKLVGIFSTEAIAVVYAVSHPTEPTVERWTSGTVRGVRQISYAIKEHELNVGTK